MTIDAILSPSICAMVAFLSTATLGANFRTSFSRSTSAPLICVRRAERLESRHKKNASARHDAYGINRNPRPERSLKNISPRAVLPLQFRGRFALCRS